MKQKLIIHCLAAGIGITTLPFLTSCESTAGKGAGLGAAVGALGAGFFSKDDSRSDRRKDMVKGAAIGAAVGGIGGAVVDAQKPKAYPTQGGDYGYNQNQYPAQGVGTNQQYPVGTRTNQPGVVLSPYAPNWKIDVTGFRSGELVIDPKTDRIFRVP